MWVLRSRFAIIFAFPAAHVLDFTALTKRLSSKAYDIRRPSAPSLSSPRLVTGYDCNWFSTVPELETNVPVSRSITIGCVRE